jgi:HSP20 family molecular chaperone IbpA
MQLFHRKFFCRPAVRVQWGISAMVLFLTAMAGDLAAGPCRNGSCICENWDPWPHFFCQGRDFPLEVQREKDGYVVEMELPGVKRGEIEVVAQDQVLCIAVNHHRDGGCGCMEQEHGPGKGCRAIAMNRCVRVGDGNLAKATAKLEDGILRIRIPRQAGAAEVKKIAIE